mmetsp:Transcript_80583/g.226123  ORF Transcript_80583/g.226123 Transcript_80583/m.226123 type:complete len:205 (-) Transcript_80583:13-627(-)
MPSIDLDSMNLPTGSMCHANACTQTTSAHFVMSTPPSCGCSRRTSCMRKFSPSGASCATLWRSSMASSLVARILKTVVTFVVSGMDTSCLTTPGTSVGNGRKYRMPQTSVPGILGSSRQPVQLKSDGAEKSPKKRSRTQPAPLAFNAPTTWAKVTPSKRRVTSGSWSGASAAGSAVALSYKDGYLGTSACSTLDARRKTCGKKR